MKKDRIKNYREKKSKEGYKQINIYLNKENIEKIKILKEQSNKNYSEIFEMLLEKINVTRNIKKKKHRFYGGFDYL